MVEFEILCSAAHGIPNELWGDPKVEKEEDSPKPRIHSQRNASAQGTKGSRHLLA